MDRVAQNVIAEQGLQVPAVHYVAGAIEELVDVELQPGVLEDPHGPILIEFHQHVDIAVRTGFSPGDRAEHRGVRHAEQPQPVLVSGESLQNVAKGRGHLSPRVYQTGMPPATERLSWRLRPPLSTNSRTFIARLVYAPKIMRFRFLFVCAAGAAIALFAQQYSPSLYNGMRWRQVGPFRAGRISAVAGVPGDPATYYLGTPGGGIWKSTSGGTAWKPIFDDTHQESIGSIAIARSNPNIIYVGTGDVSSVEKSVNVGNGVWKSVDAGAHWQHLGLDDTHHVVSLVVDPKNPDIVLAAALGHTYARNEERGVFRSADGGKTWTKVLYKGDNLGAVNLVADPDNPQTLFAGLEVYLTLPQAGRGGGRVGGAGRGATAEPHNYGAGV